MDAPSGCVLGGPVVEAAVAAVVAGAVVAIEDGWLLEVAAGLAGPNRFEVAGAVVVGAAEAAVEVEVPNLNRLGVELGAVALVLGAAVVVEVPDRDGNREEV